MNIWILSQKIQVRLFRIPSISNTWKGIGIFRLHIPLKFVCHGRKIIATVLILIFDDLHAATAMTLQATYNHISFSLHIFTLR